MTTSPWHLGVDSVGALRVLCCGLLVPWEGLSALTGQHMAAAQDGLMAFVVSISNLPFGVPSTHLRVLVLLRRSHS